MGESTIGKARDVETDTDLLTPQMIIARGEAIQQESHASVTRMQQMVESTMAIGQDTMVTLGVQRERLVRLRDTAGAMKAQMDMAEREIRSFTTRVFEDNLTLALLILIAVGLTGICVYRVSEIDTGWRYHSTRLQSTTTSKHAVWWAESHLISPLSE